jgi:hypothetical protein
MHLLAVVIPRFILLKEPLPPLHTMVQSRCGVIQILGAFTSPFFELPHALIEPSALRIAKAFRVAKRAFAALAHDGSIKVWGHPNFGGKNAPAGNG